MQLIAPQGIMDMEKDKVRSSPTHCFPFLEKKLAHHGDTEDTKKN